ncbi:cysteine desulfurase NifS [Craurococcus roseus]|uniref:Cysteine desulfurase n=1 Tax=Craurococcus roseus TaxID=77585 RepID=A0ABN1EX28_9PROT
MGVVPPGDGPGRAIYLDHHGSTPTDPRVVAAMLPYFVEGYANPHAAEHAAGWSAAGAVEAARALIAALVGAEPEEIFFTSGATEANNLAVLGAARAAGSGRRRVLVGATEHSAVLGPAFALADEGFTVERLPVDGAGRLDLGAVRARLGPDVALVSAMLANNEVGTIGPVAEVAALAAEQGALVHTDAAQAPCAVPIDVDALGVDLLSLSAHKACGPKGVGALFVRRGTRLRPLAHGGGQEGGLRPGTVPTPLAVGFGEACRILSAEGSQERARVAALRDRLQERLLAAVPGARVLGAPGARHPGNLSVLFPGCDADALVGSLQPGLAVATGAACSSGTPSPSHVLLAMGLSVGEANSVVRFGIGRGNTEGEVEHAARVVGRACRVLRGVG